MAAIQTLQRMLSDTAVLGIHTNLTLLNRIVRNPQFIAGKITTQFIPDQQAQLLAIAEEIPDDVVSLAYAVLLRKQQEEAQLWQSDSDDSASPWFSRDYWRLNQPAHSTLRLWHAQKGWIHLRAGYSLPESACSAITVLDENQITLFYKGEQWQFFTLKPAAVEKDAQSRKSLQAPMPGTVVSIDVKPGQTVAAGDRLLTLEAMKMEHALLAPHAGKIKTIFYKPGDRVKEGIALLEFA